MITVIFMIDGENLDSFRFRAEAIDHGPTTSLEREISQKLRLAHRAIADEIEKRRGPNQIITRAEKVKPSVKEYQDPEK